MSEEPTAAPARVRAPSPAPVPHGDTHHLERWGSGGTPRLDAMTPHSPEHPDRDRLPDKVSDVFDPTRWRVVEGFDFEDMTLSLIHI